MEELILKGKEAQKAARFLATVSTKAKNEALEKIGELLLAKKQEIINENDKDLIAAREKNITKAMLDRLTLIDVRIEDMAKGAIEVAALPDPVGEVIGMWKNKAGLQIGKQRVPLGVIGIIYEARPNVTLDAAALCLKTGNAVILRGGSEAINSNKAIVKVIGDALESVGFPRNCVQLVEDTSRETAREMMRLNEYIDVLIPRGGAGLIKSVVENSNIPVIQTGVGNCHVYVDSETDLEMAKNILINAKCSRPAVCNACETLLVHEKVAEEFLPLAYSGLKEYNVEIRACDRTLKYIPSAVRATEEDWDKEFSDYIIAIKIVDSLEEAIDHINEHGTKHSEAIVTTNYFNSQKFLREIDAAAVYVNASTRFTDGFEFGFGAEIGISTQKLHARGPMGLNELTTIKYIIYGEGQVR
ncbi:glutamate-5-semialdehyde dehydrogenase [Clostridium sp. 'White wine YQ']|uniref:glutamate-5-semialdehyde dehydrogenase n=1 Tax=Clostridium sp. 'White wine YQ' TaxID=3027474 RepID=UPI002366CCB4|nr:glutamate-5-semialdehyde dehydrogenase [Clostridium sp. 'White wine YQ']MDD7795163.1 glutamate-5-semialdehyde dehydrogenase [Clostridium sp. 'White wine YQ']